MEVSDKELEALWCVVEKAHALLHSKSGGVTQTTRRELSEALVRLKQISEKLK